MQQKRSPLRGGNVTRSVERRQPVSRAVSIAAFAFAFTASVCSDAAVSEAAVFRTVPSRIIPMPDTISPALQKLLAAPEGAPLELPKTIEEWKALVKAPPGSEKSFSELLKVFGVTVAPQLIGGVTCYVFSPKFIKPGDRNRLLLGFHAGGWIWGGGVTGNAEAVMLASVIGYKVISVDYRLLPDHPFPAAMDDAIAVWKEVVKSTDPRDVAVFGSSVGASLVLSLVQRAKKEGLPLPGAVVSDSPWSDLSKTGDSYYTNAGVDNIFTYDGFWEALAKLYAGGRDLKDPELSPVYGDFSGFPPTFLLSGTRDAFLSNTVRVQRKLLEAGVPTQLEVAEGQPHGWFVFSNPSEAPEAADVYGDIGRFFDAYLHH